MVGGAFGGYQFSQWDDPETARRKAASEAQRLAEAKKKADEHMAQIRRDEESKWAQRAKVKHVQEGGSNTRYFHLIANGKHRKKMNFATELSETHCKTENSWPKVLPWVLSYYSIATTNKPATKGAPNQTAGEDGHRVGEKIKNKHGTCQLESTSNVSSYFHHRGEELVFRGNMGSGTIFFTSCNVRCSFC